MNSLACHASISAEEARLKAEQSATSDLPLYALTVEMREGILAASSATIKSPFGQVPASYFKRTAHALATLAPQDKEQQAATMGCLPAFTGRLSLTVKKGESVQASAICAPRRALLPPVKTVIMPSDPAELRLIVDQLQQKRSEKVQNARATARLQTLNMWQVNLDQQSGISLMAKARATAVFALRNQTRRLSHLLGDFIDKLAVA